MKSIVLYLLILILLLVCQFSCNHALRKSQGAGKTGLYLDKHYFWEDSSIAIYDNISSEEIYHIFNRDSISKVVYLHFLHANSSHGDGKIIIPPNFVNATKLKYLTIGTDNIDLTNLFKGAATFRNLQVLSIGLMEKEVPDEIGDLDQLTKLEITNSGITYLPASMGNLKNLKVLILQGSKSIGSANSLHVISRMSALRYLSLQKTGLDTLTNSIGNLKELRYLNISENNIKCIPDSFSNLTKLNTINALGNNFNAFCISPALINIPNLNIFTSMLIGDTTIFNSTEREYLKRILPNVTFE